MARTHEDTLKEYKDLVNMTKAQLKKWLASEESQSVGIKKNTSSEKKTSSGGSESTGHESGKMILALMDKTTSKYTDDDYSQMSRTTAYIKRHLAQKPSKEDITTSRWRYSLMNWGHDPLKNA